MGSMKPQPSPGIAFVGERPTSPPPPRADYKGPKVAKPATLPPPPPRACRKHAENPVKGYSRCVGCEVERLRSEVEALREWIRDEGENNNTCTYGVLREVCEHCQCGRK